MSEEHRDEPFLRTVAAVQAQMSLINAESDELTDLRDMQAQRKLKTELNEYVSAHSDSGIIPSNPLEVIGGRLKALSKFFSDTKSLELELLNIGENISRVKKFTSHHGRQVKAPIITFDSLEGVLVKIASANKSLPSKLELLESSLNPLDWDDSHPETKLHSELPLCASASQIDIPEDTGERANLHAFVHGAGPIHDKVKKHLEQIEKKTRELIKTHELYRKTIAVILECTKRGDHIKAFDHLDAIRVSPWVIESKGGSKTILDGGDGSNNRLPKNSILADIYKTPFDDLHFTECQLEVDKLQKSCEDIITFCSNLPKACNDALDDYWTTEGALGFGKITSKKFKDKLANLKIKLEEHDTILKSYRNSELENKCKPFLETAHTDLAKAEVKLADLTAKGSRYRRRTWITISVVVVLIGLVIADQTDQNKVHQLVGIVVAFVLFVVCGAYIVTRSRSAKARR